MMGKFYSVFCGTHDCANQTSFNSRYERKVRCTRKSLRGAIRWEWQFCGYVIFAGILRGAPTWFSVNSSFCALNPIAAFSGPTGPVGVHKREAIAVQASWTKRRVSLTSQLTLPNLCTSVNNRPKEQRDAGLSRPCPAESEVIFEKMPPNSAPSRGLVASMSTRAFTAETRPEGSLMWTGDERMMWVLVEVLSQQNTLLKVRRKDTGELVEIDLVSSGGGGNWCSSAAIERLHGSAGVCGGVVLVTSPRKCLFLFCIARREDLSKFRMNVGDFMYTPVSNFPSTLVCVC